MMERFKIDLAIGYSQPYGLFLRRKRALASDRWELLDRFSTQDEAKAFYEKIKDLPEYLP